VIQKQDGRFVKLSGVKGLSETGTYAFSTPDANDAHDFKNSVAAEKWLRGSNMIGEIRVLNDDGSWPLE
jgi:hypothetical protein